MADIHNELKLYPELQRGVHAMLGVGELHPGIIRCDETLGIQFDPWSRDEFAWPRGERLFGVMRAVAAGAAGTFSFLGIRNPVGSQKLVAVLGWDMGNVAVALGYQLFAGPVSATGIVSGPSGCFGRDLRDPQAGGNDFVQFIDGATNPIGDGLPGPIWGITPGTNEVVPYRTAIILPPGFEARMYASSAVTPFTAAAWGSSRKLLKLEQQG